MIRVPHPGLRRLYRDSAGARRCADALAQATETCAGYAQRAPDLARLDGEQALAALLAGTAIAPRLAAPLDRIEQAAAAKAEPEVEAPRRPRPPPGSGPGLAAGFEPERHPRIAALRASSGGRAAAEAPAAAVPASSTRAPGIATAAAASAQRPARLAAGSAVATAAQQAATAQPFAAAARRAGLPALVDQPIAAGDAAVGAPAADEAGRTVAVLRAADALPMESAASRQLGRLVDRLLPASGTGRAVSSSRADAAARTAAPTTTRPARSAPARSAQAAEHPLLTASPAKPATTMASAAAPALAAGALPAFALPAATEPGPVPGLVPGSAPATPVAASGLRRLAALASGAAPVQSQNQTPAAFASSLATGAGRPAISAALAEEMTAILRREAERHGIPLTGIEP